MRPSASSWKYGRMEPAFTKKRSEKRLKLGFPLEVNLVTAAGQIPLGRGGADISKF